MSPMPSPERDLQRLLAEEPFVRDLARQLVAGDADEVVQRTWLRAVQQGGAGVERPRHWLARILRNVVANLRRDDRRRAARERGGEAQDLVPSSQELALREESRRALVAAVDALPATLRTVVLLRWFDGQPPRRIAEALGVPAATVSTQLQRALVLLRQRLDADHGGDRRAWMLPLVPFALRPELPLAPPALPVVGAPGVPTVLLGAITMTSKAQLAAAAGAIALAAGAWWMLHDPTPPAPNPPVPPAPLVAGPQSGSLGLGAGDTVPAVTTEREVAPTPNVATRATTGTVIARVRRHDRTPAVGTVLALQKRGTNGLFDSPRQRTDAAGIARFETSPGRVGVVAESSWHASKRVDVPAGQTVEIELDLEAGLEVRGIVVDVDKKPVAGALVEMTMMGRADLFPEVAAVTGADGRFALLDCPEVCLVAARAMGHVASNVRFLRGKPGNTAEVELVLGRDGGAVSGVVVDPAGKPVAGAVVIVGDGEVSGIPGRDHIPPFGGLTRSDERGAFLVVGVAAGKQSIRARGRGCAPWLGEVEVAAGATVTQRVELGPGAVLRGHVVDAAGRPVARAEVAIGQWGEIGHYETVTDAEGAFELTGLPVGELPVRAGHDDHGKARATVSTSATTATTCRFELSRGLELKGRVVDPDGQPVGKAMIECLAEEGGPERWYAFVATDAHGAFVAANRPARGTLRLTVHADGHEPLFVRGIDPGAEPLLRLERVQPASVHISARVVDPEGRPVANARAGAFRRGVDRGSADDATDNDGRFELGPLPPGEWAMYVRADGYPAFRCDHRTLGANATWNLGTITLVRGGTARVRQVGAPIDDARFLVSDAARSHSFGVMTTPDGPRSEVLAPGDYVLLVLGTNVAATAVPFTIRAGEEIVVDTQIERANPQAFRCAVPAGTNVDFVTLQLFRGEVFVGRVWVDLKSVRPGDSTGLAPGEYRAVAEVGTLRGTTSFTVGATSGPPVTVVLR
jgi:RNA polymerase sigma factor (sigma-70 family)